MSSHRFYAGADPRDPRRLFWLSLADRRAHWAIAGGSGAGKTSFLTDEIMQDVVARRGLTMVDPKGDLYQDVLAAMSAVPEEKWPALASNLVLIDPSDPASTASFNPLEVSPHGSPSRQRQETISVFRKVWGLDDRSTPRLFRVFRRAVQLGVEAGLTLADVQRILSDASFREALVARTRDESLRTFWLHEFPSDSSSNMQQWISPVMTRLEALLDDPNVRRLLSQPRSSFDFREIMDGSRVCLINLSKGRLGEESSALIGGLLVARFQLAAESRQETWPPEARPLHTLYLDEAQNFITRSFEEMLAEARGYSVSIVICHQHLAQLPDSLRHAILANCRIRMAFRLSSQDAAVMAPEMWRFQGDRVKSQEWEWINIGRLPLPVPKYDYYSASEEGRMNREWLHHLPDRHFWLHVQGWAEPRLLRTVDIPRSRLVALRDRARRFKELVAATQARPQLDERPRQQQGARGSYEWVRGPGGLEVARED